ncbi:class I SAM-dependent methyltransferase [Nitrosopumilus sp.]|uniref:class I SAM-dependent methyltransferase n=1 Tax=Nitrosopumilus sp. TaxID=2024843 RepID=UPI00292FA51A|nr:class I SAM-dependent methyltransferase [Nitrosopumilus sp.]
MLEEINCPICNSAENKIFWIMKEIENSTKENFRYVKCNDCDLVYTSPRRNDVEYYQKLPSSYLSDLDWYVKSISVKGLMWMLDEFEKKWFKEHQHRGKMLEIGCAMGHFLYTARARTWETLGIEFVKDAADWAKKFLQLDIIESPAETSTIDEGNFDCVVGIEMIEHVRNPLEILEKVKKWLKPGGMVFFSTPNIESNSMKTKKPWEVLDPRDHLTLFSKKTITNTLEKVGFTNIIIDTFGGGWRQDESMFVYAIK